MKRIYNLALLFAMVAFSAYAYDPTIQPLTYGSGPPASAIGNLGADYVDVTAGVHYKRIAGAWKVLLPTGTGAVDIPDSISTLTVTSAPALLQNFQRASFVGGASNKGVASVPIGINLSAASPIQWEVDDFTSGSVIETGTLGSQPSGASTVNIPVSARIGWDTLKLKTPGGTPVATTSQFGVGELVAYAGQSITQRKFHNLDTTNTPVADGLTASPYFSMFVNYVDGAQASLPTWGQPVSNTTQTGYNSAYLYEFGTRAVSALGVNVSAIGATFGSTASETWVPGQSNNTALKNAINAAGGSFRTFFWLDGESNAQGNDTAATYQSNMTSIFSDLQTTYGTGWKLIEGTIPGVTNNGFGTGLANNVIRTAGVAYAAANPSFVTQRTPLDVSLLDGIHQDNSLNGTVRHADHDLRDLKMVLGLDTYGDAGPILAGTATRASTSAVINLPVTQTGGTALVTVGTPATQFQCFPYGSTSSPYTISSLSVTPTNIALTLSAAPADTVGLSCYYRLPLDASNTVVSSGIYDNNTSDGINANGRQLQLYPASITVPRPDAGPLVASNAYPMTITGGSYAADANTNFGQGLTGATSSYGITAAAYTMPAAPWTVGVCFSGVATAPASGISVLFGQSGSFFIGYDTAGHAQVGVGSPSSTNLNSTTLINDSAHHCIELDQATTGYKFYLDGALAATSSTATPVNPSAVLSVRRFASGNSFMSDGAVTDVYIESGNRHTAAYTADTTPPPTTEAGYLLGYAFDGNGNSKP